MIPASRNILWSADCDRETEGVWLDHYNQQELPGLMKLHLGEIEGGGGNCAIYSPVWGGWLQWTCSVTKEAPIMCLCEKEDPVFLTLRGLCKDSNIDTVWVTRNIQAELFYLGIQNTEMWYDYSKKHWKIRTTGRSEHTRALSDNSFHSFLLGKSRWYIEKDNDGKGMRKTFLDEILSSHSLT